ncbi:MAG: L-2-hydroxyglutarate oxidase [Cyclobacteriaceae bacterium]|nr:L-2-hydroxyglutarate oxidase [Cyclobacteriaceae bacterium]
MKRDIIIIGGGIVGLATAMHLKKLRQNLNILLLEKEPLLAAHQTGNNSGVIHSGIYYKPGSLKANNCIRGYAQLIRFCDQESIPYELCGKVIVATEKQELPYLEKLYHRGHENGLKHLQLLEKEALLEIEPHVNGIKGIKVPQTGIIDYTAVSMKYAEIFEKMGGEILTGQKVREIRLKNGASEVICNNSIQETRLIVNCAGLYSDKIARMTGQETDVKIIPFRGEYYELTEEKQYLVKHLIYPVPDPNFPFLGVHFTRMIKGGIEAGPNAVLAFAREGYTRSKISPPELLETLTWPGFIKVMSKYWKTGMGEMYRSFSKRAFTHALQRLIPEIQEQDLTPAGAGIRAQACDRTGGLLDDFLILENEHAVNVCNAPSPAATSSMSIGENVANRVLMRMD